MKSDLLAELTEYGGFPRITRIGCSFLTLPAKWDSSESDALQGIREIELKPVVLLKFISKLFQKKGHLQMTYGIRRYHQFKSIEVSEDMFFD